MRAGFFQFDCKPRQRERNLEKVAQGLKLNQVDLLVLPELFSTGYFFADAGEAMLFSEEIPEGKTTQSLIGLAESFNCYIVGGVLEKGRQKPYNSAVVVGPSGFIGKHRKLHLTGLEEEIFSRGEEASIFSFRGIKIGLAICYDLWFPELCRLFLDAGVSLICNPANYGGDMTYDVARVRALENVMGIISANRTGIEMGPEGEERFCGESRIIDQDGKILASGNAEEKLKAVELDFSFSSLSPSQLGADLKKEISLYSGDKIKIREYREG